MVKFVEKPGHESEDMKGQGMDDETLMEWLKVARPRQLAVLENAYYIPIYGGVESFLAKDRENVD
jgi:hypothetical protein